MTAKTQGTWREHWRARLRHPSWWPRIVRHDFEAWCLWIEQGRPRDVPVVIRPGRLIVDPLGRSCIDGWHIDCDYMSSSICVDDWWDRLTAHYPVERTEEYL